MSKPTIMAPAQGSRIVRDGTNTILFGQPPEVLKGLLRHHVTSFDTLVLTDVKEKDGSVLNNLEFPFYFFPIRGHEEGFVTLYFLLSLIPFLDSVSKSLQHILFHVAHLLGDLIP